MLPALSPAVEMTGADGTPVSTVRLNGVVVLPVLPATSVALKVMAWGPSPRSVPGVKVQLPWAFTTAVPISLPSTITCTVEPTSPVPLKVGRASLVLLPDVSAPVTGPTSSITLVTTGTPGAAVSMVKVKTDELAEALPAVSVAYARRE